MSSDPSTAQQSGNTYRAQRASELIGRVVKGSQGNEVGKIEDLVVDMATGQLRYALLAFDPGLVGAERLVPVPASRLRVNARGEPLTYEATRAELQRTAQARSEWTESLFDAERIARIDQAWGEPSGSKAKYEQKLQKVGDLLNKRVNDRARSPVGELQELVLNMSDKRVHYAVVALDPGGAGQGKQVVLPLRSLRVGGNDALILEVDKARLQQAPSFTHDQFGDLNEPTLRRQVLRGLAHADVDERGSAQRLQGANDTRASGASTAPLR
jgi:sporulation protein YlmC with PRC-barrel domain